MFFNYYSQLCIFLNKNHNILENTEGQLLLTELQISVLKTYSSTRSLMSLVVSAIYRHLWEASLSSRESASNTETGQHQTEYNVVRVGNPECKQVQRLVTVIIALWIGIVWLVV